MANYEVVNNFYDKTDNRKLYEKGGFYSHVDDDRTAFLIEKGFIKKTQKKAPEEKINHVGGGYYELPNGERVKGKKEALSALESGE